MGDDYGQLNTILGRGGTYNGNLNTVGFVRVDGRVVGNIKTDGNVVVTSEARINGSINAANLILAGKIKGDVKVAESLELLKDSVIVGNISCKSLKMDESVVIHGICQVTGNKSPEKVKRLGRVGELYG